MKTKLIWKQCDFILYRVKEIAYTPHNSHTSDRRHVSDKFLQHHTPTPTYVITFNYLIYFKLLSVSTCHCLNIRTYHGTCLFISYKLSCLSKQSLNHVILIDKQNQQKQKWKTIKDYHQEKTFIISHLTYKKIQQIKKNEI